MSNGKLNERAIGGAASTQNSTKQFTLCGTHFYTHPLEHRIQETLFYKSTIKANPWHRIFSNNIDFID